MTARRGRGGLLLRLGFFVCLAGGLVLWAELRRPRDLVVDVDLTEALPGDIAEVEVTVTRERRALLQFQEMQPSACAPATVHVTVHAQPGPAEVDVILIDAHGRVRRTRATVELRGDRVATVHAR